MRDKILEAAYHEAGHIVVAVLLGATVRSAKLDGFGQGATEVFSPGDDSPPSNNEQKRFMLASVSDQARAIKLKTCRVLWNNAVRKCAGWAAERHQGFAEDFGSTQDGIDLEAHAQKLAKFCVSMSVPEIMIDARNAAVALVDKNAEMLERVAKALFANRTLTQEQIADLVRREDH
jgi:hypothetical protein